LGAPKRGRAELERIGSRTRRRLVSAALAAAAVAVPAAAGAAVKLPAPGVIRVTDLPARVSAGERVVLREVLPLAVHHGSIRLQRRLSSRSWRQVASAAVNPRVFWLYWRVPRSWAGSSVTLRFVLRSRAKRLAVSPRYAIAVGP
jgi:hypothetical protein